MKSMKRFMSMALAALLVFSTLASDYMVANAEEIVEEATEVSEYEEVVEAPVWEEIPAEETVEAVAEEVTEETVETPNEEFVQEDEQNGDIESEATEEIDEEEAIEEEEEAVEEVEEETTEVDLSEEPIEFASVKASNGLIVKVYAPAGAFPEGTDIVVTAISEAQAVEYAENALADDQTEVVDAKGVDITFYYEGEEIEPAKAINVTFDNANLEGADDYSLIHVDDNQNTEVIADADVDQNGAEAELEEFSVYVVAGTAEIINASSREISVEKGKSVTIYIDDEYYGGSWSTKSNLVSLSNPTTYWGRPQITITGVKVGDSAEVKYTYGTGRNKREYIVKVTVTEGNCSITFDLNGGRGTAPEAIEAVKGEEVVLPSYTGTKNGATFVGWCTDSDANGYQKYTNHVYPAGSIFTMGDKDVKLYATWSEENVDGDFFIRYDGTIPYEPSPYGTNLYTNPAIHIANAIKVGKFTTSTEGVDNNLNDWPKDEQIKAVYPSYDKNSQYVLWYVIKREQTWHVDGVLLEKTKVNLTYDANAPVGVWSNIPAGSQFHVGETTQVSSKQPARNDGYTFVGWNTKADGTGTAYAPSQDIVMNSNITLYAQWENNTLVTIKAASAEKKYDGTPLTAPTLAEVKGLPAGYTVEAVVTGTITDAGEVANVITSYIVKDASGKNVTADFKNVKKVDGTLTVTKRTIIMTSADASKAYDGTPLTNSNVAVTGDGFVGNDGATYDVTGTITTPGTTNNAFTYTLKAGTKADNYEIRKNEGTLSITKNETPIIITANSASKMYDGTALADAGYTYTQGVLVTGDTLTATVAGEITDAGTEANVVKSYKVMRGNVDVTAGYTFGTSVNGTLTVTPRNITLTSANDSKEYDGTALTNNEITVTGDGFVGTDNYTANVTGTITDPGTVKNAFTYTVTGNAGNYKFTKVEGDLTVTKNTKTITITAKSDEKVYDGSALTNGGFDYTEGVLASTDTLTAVVEGSQINAGESANKVTSYKVMRGTKDVTDYYTFGESVDGKLNVTKKAVTLTSGSDEKTYDGTALTKNVVTVTAGGFVGNEGFDFQTTGTITDPGSEPNTFDYTLKNGALAENYDITKVNGILKINKVTTPIVITAKSDNKTYDGTPLTNDGYTYTTGVLVAGDTLTATVAGEITDAGTADNVVESYKVMRGSVDVTGNYTFGESENGVLTVNPRAVTIKSADASKVYDGTALTKNEVNVTAGSFVTGEGADYTVTGTITNAGSVPNAYEYRLKANTKAQNYVITKEVGTLTVSKKGQVVVTITGNSDTTTYNGTEQSVTGYTVSISDPLYKEEYISFKGKDVAKGTVAGTYPMGLKVADFENINENFENVTFVVYDGGLVINPIATKIVITAASDEKVYDGSALTNAEYTYTEKVLVEGDVLTATVEGTITDVGTADNKVTSYVVMRGTTDVTDNYTFGTSVDGTLKVTKRSVTLTSGTDSKTYDGTPLTKKEVNVTAGSFVTGEGYTANVTGTITNVGTTKNTFTYTLNEGTKAGNYEVHTVKGDLTINKITTPIVITAASDSKKYDGTALTNAGYTYTENVLVEGDVLAAVVEGTITNVGTAENSVASYVVKRGDEDVTANYTFGTSVNGTLKVTKRSVKLTSATDSKTYDGTPLTNDTITVTGDGFAKGEGYTADVIGTITEVGETANTFTYGLTAGTLADNYDITKTEGTLSISPLGSVKVYIRENSDTKTYNGKEQSVTGYTVESISSNLYTRGDFTFNGEAVAKGTDVGTYDMNLTPKNFTNNNANFKDVEFVIIDGTLNITPITTPIVITAASDSKKYDGTALTNAGYTYTENVLVEGDVLTATVEGTITNVGTAENKVTSYVVKRGDSVVTDNYNFGTSVNGTLEVIPRTVKLTSATASKTYDGTPLTAPTVSATAEGFDGFVNGEGATYNVTGTITNIGTTNNAFTYVLNEGTKTGNYTISTVEGTLEVTPITAEIEIKADSAKKMYDGTALTKATYSYPEKALAEGDTLTAVVEGTITNVGTVANKVTSYKVMRGEEDVTRNYSNIKTTDGVLEVTKRSVKLTSATDGKTYDGTPLTNDTITVTGDGFVEGEGYTADVTGTITNVGTVDNTFSYTLNDGTLAANYDIEKVYGKLTVTRRGNVVVTIVGNSDSKVYNGTEQNVTGYVVENIVGGVYTEADFEFTGNAEAKGTDVGEYPMDLKESDFVNKNDNFDSVRFVVTDGKLTITPITAQIEIKAASDKKMYDGSSLTNATFTKTEGVLKAGDEITAVVEGTITDVGTTDNVVASYKVMRGEKDVTGNYSDIKTTNGTLEVTKRTVKLTSADGKKVYDGTPLTNDTITVSGDGFADGEGYTANVTGTITNIGTTNNAFTYVLNEGTKAGNYTISTEEGTLEVTPITAEIEIKADSAKKMYDGTALTKATYSYPEKALAEGDTLTAVVEGTITNVGTVANEVTSYKVMRGEEDVTRNYSNIQTTDGVLEVTKRSVKLTSATDSKTYDGTPLTNDTITVSGDGFAKGEGYTADVTGTITYKGTVDNAFTYVLNDGTLDSNYDIDTEVGTLSITQVEKEIIITAASDEKKYDGAALTNEGFTFTEGVLVEGDELEVVVEGTITNVGNAVNKVTSYRVVRDGRVVTENYKFGESVDGTLVVTQRSVKLTSGTATKEYDGKPLTNGIVIESGDGFIVGEGASYDVTGTITDKGTVSNDFTYELNEGTLADNYNIETEFGTLTVTGVEKEIVIQAPSATKEYDGQPLSDNKYVIASGALAEGDELVVEVRGEIVNVGETVNEIASYKVMRGELDVTDNYAFGKALAGKLTITPAPLTLVLPSVEKEYDGKPIVIGTLVPQGLKNGETMEIKFADIAKDVSVDAEGNVIPYVGDVIANSDLSSEWTSRIGGGEEVVIGGGEEVVIGGGEEVVIGGGEVVVRTESVGSKFTAFFDKVRNTVISSFGGAGGNQAKPGNYNLNIIPGSYKIIPKPIVVQTDSATKSYDGKALTAEGRVLGLVDGDTVTLTLTGAQKSVGSSVNTYSLVWDGTAKKTNYIVGEDLGTLKVTGSNTPAPTPGEDPDPGVLPGTNLPTGGDGNGTPEDPGVLGARRGIEADGSSVLGANREQAVLGARRGAATGDENAMAMYIMLMGASASFAGVYTIARRKKRELGK